MNKRLFLITATVFAMLTLPVQAEVGYPSHAETEAIQIAEQIRSHSARLRSITDAVNILDQIKIKALDVRNYADRLETYANSPNRFSVESHAAQLMQIRESVNGMVPDLQFLETSTALLPRQQLALHYIFSDAMKLSKNAEAAIRYLNDDPNHLWGDAYEQAVSAIYRRADRIIFAAKMSDSLLDAGKYLEKLNREMPFEDFAGL